MKTMTPEHEAEVLTIARRNRHDPEIQALLVPFLPLLCRSSNRFTAREAGRLFLAADRRRLGDGDAA